jgi:superfamily II DNA or RNA helicase
MNIAIGARIFIQGAPDLYYDIVERTNFSRSVRKQMRYGSEWDTEYVNMVRGVPFDFSIPAGLRHLITEEVKLLTSWEVGKGDPCFDLPGEDRGSQHAVLQAIYTAHRQGQYATCIIAPCGSGKTRMGIRLVGQLGQHTLILCHTKELQDQWLGKLREVFDNDAIGWMKNGKEQAGRIQVALMQTAAKLIHSGRNLEWGVLIVDECHHTPCSTLTTILDTIAPTVRIGLTASEKRKDGLHPLIYAYLGPIVACIDQDSAYEEASAIPPRLCLRNTNFSSGIDATENYTALITALVEDRERNLQIAKDILLAYRHGRHTLVLSSRVKHLHALLDTVAHAGIDASTVQVLTGKEPKVKRQQAMANMLSGQSLVTFATTPLAKEGLDAPILDCLILATPTADLVTTQQSVGRIQRVLPGKPQPIVFDYLDAQVRVLKNQFEKRMSVYRKLRTEGM